MPTTSERTELVVFERYTATEDEVGGEVVTWTTYAIRRAYVRFGTAQEKREVAREAGAQTATFECFRDVDLNGVTLKDRIFYLDSYWDINEIAPLDRMTIRFTAVRVL